MPPSDSQNGMSVLFFLFPPTACNLKETCLLTSRERQVAIFARSSSQPRGRCMVWWQRLGESLWPFWFTHLSRKATLFFSNR